MILLAQNSDFDFIFELYMHSKINPFLLYEKMEKVDFFPIFKELMDHNQLYIFKENEENIGMCKLIFQNYRNEHIVYLGGLAIHFNYMGKGLGMKMMKEIIDFCLEKNIKRIELSTAIYNEKAIKLYESVGFEKEGILRNYTFLKSENRYIDEVMMSFIKS